MSNLNLLRPSAIFTKVVQLGSFKAAALEFGMSQSVVSQSVTDLEASLGVQLLYRTTRKLTVTEAGRRFFENTTMALSGLDLAIGAVKGDADAVQGTLRLTAPTILASPAFAKFIKRFTDTYPNLTLKIDLTDTHKDLIDDRCDLGIRITNPDQTIKGARLIFSTHGCLCGSRALAAALANGEALENLCFIRTPEMGKKLSLTPIGGGKKREIRPVRTLEVNSGQLVRTLVEEGAGFAVFPNFAIREALASGQMVQLLPQWTTGKYGFFTVLASRNAELSIANKFADDLCEFLNSQSSLPSDIQS